MCYCVSIVTDLLPEAHKSTEEVEWQRDAEPKAEQHQQSGERDGRARSSPPQKEIEHKEHRKHNPAIKAGEGKNINSTAMKSISPNSPRHQEGTEKDVTLPMKTAHDWKGSV